MLILSIPEMTVSSRLGWPGLERSHPPLARLFLTLVLPLSLLPPAMLYYAGSHYGDAFAAGYGAKPWAAIAAIFFVAEMLTLAAMGWLIRQVAAIEGVRIDRHDAYTLASIAPVPLWLSALGLLAPSLAFNVGLSLLAVAASGGLIYHGIYALCHMEERIVAAAIAESVMATGLAAWVLLLVLLAMLI